MAKRPLIFGILNVTPDSFSDGGLFADVPAAIAHAHAMVAAGADVIDVGGESTRPGAARIDVDEEQKRVLPVVRALCGEGIVVSIDTMRAATATAAVSLGATYVNDVSGGLADPGMVTAVTHSPATYIAMHWRGDSEVMSELATYEDVTAEVMSELSARVEVFMDKGLEPNRLWLDPGLGFAKEADHNWALLRDLDQLVALGYPVLVGASRKRFLSPFGEKPIDRDEATATISVLAADAGAAAVRVHDVGRTARAFDVRNAWVRGEA
jgi:dihydropteroate synthase